MGAIVSSRKSPSKGGRSTVTKTLAVASFSKRESKSDGSDVASAETSKENALLLNSDRANVLVASWGEGILSPKAPSRESGTVTSRGITAAVKPSRLYEPLGKNEAAVKIQTYYRGYVARQRFQKRIQLVVKLQSCIRGYQSRQMLKQEQTSAVVIQKRYRKHIRSKKVSRPKTPGRLTEREKTQSHSPSSWRQERSRSALSNSTSSSQGMLIGEKTKESFDNYKDDIEQLRWKGEQQEERNAMGKGRSPRKILLIASNIPRANVLAKIIRDDDIISIIYDFTNSDCSDIIKLIREKLADYHPGTKAMRLGLACNGGPGHLYIVQGKVLTTKKLAKDEDSNEFVKDIGKLMSKLDPENTKMHIISNNVCGNKAGSDLLRHISKVMLPNVAHVEAPIEVTKAGIEMLSDYFDLEKYKVWKKNRFSKLEVKM